MDEPVFLDFEASSLRDDSYPIEVAWGASAAAIETHLISPEGIPTWTDWAESAERIHGITRTELLRNGQSPALVAKQLNEMLRGRQVFTDAPDFDRMWLARLFEQYWSPCEITLRHVDELFWEVLRRRFADQDEARRYTVSLQRVARRRAGGRQHRAGDDVAYLVELWNLVQSGTGYGMILPR